MKKAFTLAEVMICLVIIGVLAGVLLPAAKNSMANDDVIRFKDTHNAFLQAIQELSISDKYFIPGDLTRKPDGSFADCCYHANAFADLVAGKVISCPSGVVPASSTPDTQSTACICNDTDLSNFKTSDTTCTTDYGVANMILKGTTNLACNNIIELNNKMQIIYNPPFGNRICTDSSGFPAVYGISGFALQGEINFDYNGDGNVNAMDATKHLRICAGLVEGELMETFSYAVRQDGRVLMSDKVVEWTNKSVQGR